MSQPLISVIMPVYNCHQYVQAAIKSILDQTLTDFELLVIDDASTDHTVQVVEQLSDSRLRLIKKEKNSGYTNSLNMGLNIARGKYIARMDGDDISVNVRFAKQVALLESNPDVVACGTWFQIMDSDRVINHPASAETIKTRLMDYCVIGHPSVMIRKKILDEHQIRYDLSYEPAEDYELWVRLLSYGRLLNVPEVLFHYRMHSNQVSSKKAALQQSNTERCQIKMLQYLMPEVSDIEKTEHLKFIYGNVGNLAEIKAAMAWGDHLRKVNDTRQFFDKSTLDELITEKKNNCVRNFLLNRQQQTPKTIIDFLKVRRLASDPITKPELVKLLFKCVIFWKSKPHVG